MVSENVSNSQGLTSAQEAMVPGGCRGSGRQELRDASFQSALGLVLLAQRLCRDPVSAALDSSLHPHFISLGKVRCLGLSFCVALWRNLLRLGTQKTSTSSTF